MNQILHNLMLQICTPKRYLGIWLQKLPKLWLIWTDHLIFMHAIEDWDLIFPKYWWFMIEIWEISYSRTFRYKWTSLRKPRKLIKLSRSKLLWYVNVCYDMKLWYVNINIMYLFLAWSVLVSAITYFSKYAKMWWWI